MLNRKVMIMFLITELKSPMYFRYYQIITSQYVSELYIHFGRNVKIKLGLSI